MIRGDMASDKVPVQLKRGQDFKFLGSQALKKFQHRTSAWQRSQQCQRQASGS